MVAAIADALGTPLMPWQRLVADVAGERNPDGSYAYPIVVVSVPRQSGKTTLQRARLVARCVMQRGVQTFYTAQSGKDARERWRDLTKQIAASPLRNRTTIRAAAGSERLVFANGSELRVFAPVASALHGYTPPEVHLDEAWAHDALRGEELMGAIVPAQITVRDRQLWIVSTAGTAESGFFRRWYDAALEQVPGVAGFVWAAPEGADPYDPDTWRAFHPALGHTITEADLAASAASHSRAEYERAYCNRWTRTSSAIIAADVWARGRRDLDPPPAGAVTLAYDVAHDRTSADVVAAWRVGDQVAVKIVQAQAGYGWVADAARDLRASLGAQLAADDHGPAVSVTEDLDNVRVLNPAEYANACGEFLAAVNAGRIVHDGDARLAQAAADVVWRPMQSDLWGWSRRASAGTVSPIIAATIAVWLAEHRAPEPTKPFVVFGR